MTVPFLLGAQLEGELGKKDQWVPPIGHPRIWHIPVRWDEIETSEGDYNFPVWIGDTITRLENKVGKDGYQLIMGVKCTPKFYSTYPQARNAPPIPENYIDFAEFCKKLCEKYNPFAIEIWNEPEFTIQEAGSNDEYYGGFGADGTAYGKMVITVYDLFRFWGMETKIISGASFGFIDPRRAIDFLRLAVKAGMQSDYWSWHSYIWYYIVQNNTKRFRDILRFSWDVQEIYNVPQIISETSILRKTSLPELVVTVDGVDTYPHLERQIELLNFYLRHRDITNIESVLWYTLTKNGWNHTDLIRSGVPMTLYDLWATS